MDSDNRKFLILGGIAVIVLIAVFFYILNNLLGSGDASSEQVVTPFPESGDRNDLPPQGTDDYDPFASSSSTAGVNYPDVTGGVDQYGEGTDPNTIPDVLRDREEADWRDPVVSFSGQGTVADPDTTSTEPSSGGTSGSPYSIDDLVAGGLMLDYPDPSAFYPKTVTLGDGTEMSLEDALDLDKFTEATNPIPSLAEIFDRVESCGTLQMPTSESGVKDFLSRLYQFDQVVCMGEAVANDCDYAWAEVITPDKVKMWVYVAEKEDGSCGYGNTYKQGHVRLCDLAEAMNIATDENMPFESWQDQYTKMPGEMFSTLYATDAEYTGAAGLGCDLYEI